jgi:hypothetical protein
VGISIQSGEGESILPLSDPRQVKQQENCRARQHAEEADRFQERSLNRL